MYGRIPRTSWLLHCNFPGFNRASRCVGRKTVELSVRIVSKSAAVCKCLATEITLSTTLQSPPTLSMKHRAFQCLNWILHGTSGYLTR